MNGLLVVVAKGADRLGTLALYQTYSSGFAPGRIDTFLPACQVGDTEPYCPTAFAAKSTALDIFHDVSAAAFADPTTHRNPRVYVSPANHELCAFASELPAGYCAHTAEAFSLAEYAALTVHGDAAVPAQVDFATSHTGTYYLRPLGELWWLHRASVGAGELFGNARTYQAPSADQPGTGLRFPELLATQDTVGNLGMAAPWGWAVADGFGVAPGIVPTTSARPPPICGVGDVAHSSE